MMTGRHQHIVFTTSSVAASVAIGIAMTVAIAWGGTRFLGVAKSDASTPERRTVFLDGLFAGRVVEVMSHASVNQVLSEHLHQELRIWGMQTQAAGRCVIPEIDAFHWRMTDLARSVEQCGWLQEDDGEHSALPHWYVPEASSLGFDRYTNCLWALHVVDASGWPFRAFSSSVRLAPIAAAAPHHSMESRDAIAIESEQATWAMLANKAGGDSGVWRQWRSLPLKPLWCGLAFDVLFWSAAALASMQGVHAAMRRRRWRRGRCGFCNYQLGALRTCPECGANAP